MGHWLESCACPVCVCTCMALTQNGNNVLLILFGVKLLYEQIYTSLIVLDAYNKCKWSLCMPSKKTNH